LNLAAEFSSPTQRHFRKYGIKSIGRRAKRDPKLHYSGAAHPAVSCDFDKRIRFL
jgi:hypothetical protein